MPLINMKVMWLFYLFLWITFLNEVWPNTNLESLDLPFEQMLIFEGSIPGKHEERIIKKAKKENDVIVFQQSDNKTLIVPVRNVRAVLPILSAQADMASLESLRAAVKVLERSREGWSQRQEVSDDTLKKWQDKIQTVIEMRKEELRASAKQKEQADTELQIRIQKAIQEKEKEQQAIQEAEKIHKRELVIQKTGNYQVLCTRSEIEEALKISSELDTQEREKIPKFAIATEYWSHCLSFPDDVAMPGNLGNQKEPAIALVIDPYATGTALTALAWGLFFLPLVVTLHGLARFLTLLQERAWVGAGLWFGICVAAGICLFLLFFSERGSGVELGNGGNTEMRSAWLALANAKEKEVTRFAEKIEIPSRIFLQQIVGNMKNPDPSSKAWVPTITRLPAVGGDMGFEIGVEVPLKWISLPVWVSFASPLPDQEISLKVTGGKIGPFSVGASGGAWIWEQIAPAYQGVVTGLGLDQGIKLILLNSEKVVVSIPEVRAKLKPSP